MTFPPQYRAQGDTGPGLAAQLLVNGSPMQSMSGASITFRIVGTIGSGPTTATYRTFVLPATWTVASGASQGWVFASLDPSSLAPNNYPCASQAKLGLEVRALGGDGLTYQWPPKEQIPFIVRTQT